ncbi:MAG: toll/interleukin-1 receptor domain-containing protein [Bacillota bacterium]
MKASLARRLKDLSAKVAQIQALMVAVSTGGPKVKGKEPEYLGLYQGIEADLDDLAADGVRLTHGNPFPSLWDWYGYWRLYLSTYAARKKYVSELYGPLVEAVEAVAREREARESGRVAPAGVDPAAKAPSIFLSHSSKDKFFVRKLADRLQARGVEVWLDEAEINVGDSLMEKIGEALDRTDFVGVVLSHNSVNSEWVQRELRAAMHKELEKRRIVVLPMLLEPVERPPFLRDKLYADFTDPGKFDSSFNLILRTLGVLGREAADPPRKSKHSERPRVIADAASRLVQFEDIRIVDLDEGLSYRPNPSRELYNVYLKLSATPPEEWQEIFEAERRFPRHSMWRRAWIEGPYIVVHCVPDEIEQYHLKDLHEDVQKANVEYRQYLTELSRAAAREVLKEEAMRGRLRKLKKRLKLG